MRLTDAQKREAARGVELYGSVRAAAQILGLPASTFQCRRDATIAEGFEPGDDWTYPASLPLKVREGCVLVGGDGHFWPGEPPVIWQAFVAVAKALKPAAIILNGDMIDGTRISRHGRLRNQRAPRVRDEIQAAREFIDMLPSKPARFWTLGNHDIRVDHYLANQAPEMDDLGATLPELFSDCSFGYAVEINKAVEVRHRMRGGMHAAWNNSLHSGRTIVTNHTHQLEAKAVVMRTGRRWGVETGMLNDPMAPQFEYTEGVQSRAHGGFAVLTFDDRGRLLPPELAEMQDNRAIFRGRVWAEGRQRRRRA